MRRAPSGCCRHDRSRQLDQALRRADRRRRRQLPLRTGHRHRLPRPQRRGQDHDDADDLRVLAADAGSSAVLGGRRTASCPTPAAGSASCSTPPPSTAAGAGARRSRSRPRRWASTRRVDELLELVGLDAGAARKRVRQYSLGMRQRLGLAHALIGDPEVLILDEPANGLDPEGMRWMRELLRDFADRGGTVLLSSHLLREVDATADRLVIIGDGRIVAQGTPEELLSAEAARWSSPTTSGAAGRARRGRPRGPDAARRRLPRRRRARGRRPRGARRRRRAEPPRAVRGRRPRAVVLRPDRRQRSAAAEPRRPHDELRLPPLLDRPLPAARDRDARRASRG